MPALGRARRSGCAGSILLVLLLPYNLAAFTPTARLMAARASLQDLGIAWIAVRFNESSASPGIDVLEGSNGHQAATMFWDERIGTDHTTGH